MQVVPVAHAFPHDPQFALAVCRSAHVPEQSLVPAGHAQLPPVHTRLPPHTCMQKPQLLTSVFRSTQEVPHFASPVAQLAEQELLLQTSPIMHRLPQLPQLLPSDVVSVQSMPQTVWFGAHSHMPAMHVAPRAQALPHEPQSRLLVCRSTHCPMAPQLVRPVEQPIAHVPLTH